MASIRNAGKSLIGTMGIFLITATTTFAWEPISVVQNERSVIITASAASAHGPGALEVGWSQFIESDNEESEWQEAEYDGLDFSIEIPYTDTRAGYLYIEVALFIASGIPEWPWVDCESDCFYSNEFWFGVEEKEEVLVPVPQEKAEIAMGTIAFHSNAQVLVVYNLAGEILGEGATENGVWKTSFAESQEFVVYEWSEAGGHKLFGAGKVLAGASGHTDVWNTGNEASVINNIYWIPSQAL